MRDSVNAQSVFRGLSYRTVGDICAQDFSIQTQNLWKVRIPFCWHCNYKRIYLKIAKSFWQNFRGNQKLCKLLVVKKGLSASCLAFVQAFDSESKTVDSVTVECFRKQLCPSFSVSFTFPFVYISSEIYQLILEFYCYLLSGMLFPLQNGGQWITVYRKINFTEYLDTRIWQDLCSVLNFGAFV